MKNNLLLKAQMVSLGLEGLGRRLLKVAGYLEGLDEHIADPIAKKMLALHVQHIRSEAQELSAEE